jgi:hypothetical protein
MRRLYLTFAPRDQSAGAWVALRDLCGADEEVVDGTDTAAAIGLLDRLLMQAPGGALGPGQASLLTASDRDRLLAAVYATEFGHRIDCVHRCAACDSSFDIDFELPELLTSLRLAPVDRISPAPVDSVLTLDDGRRVRVPLGLDELALQGLPDDVAQAALLARCMIEGEAQEHDLAVIEAWERAAPILDAELDAGCPECGATVQVHFDIQHFLLESILLEEAARIAEIHLLGATYGWHLHDILALTRGRRRAFAAAIERDRAAFAGHV